MKIIITHDQYYKKGGVERYLFDIIKGFIEAGHTVTLLVYKIDPLLPVPKGCSLHKLPVTYVPRTLRRLALSCLAVRYLKKIPHDLSISLSYAAHHDILLVNNACLKKGERCKWWLKQWIKNICELRAMQTCRYIMTHSQQVKDEIIYHHSFLKDKIHCLYPPIDTTIFSMECRDKRVQYREELGIKPHQCVLLFPSTGHKRKGLLLLLSAMKQLPSDRFVLLIAGDKPKSGKLADNIRYAGFIDNMTTFYIASDVTLLPSYHEPLGLVVLESIACGTPAVISPHVGAKELITQDHGIVLHDMTVAAMVNALLQLETVSFSMESDFAAQRSLTIEAHIQALIALALQTQP